MRSALIRFHERDRHVAEPPDGSKLNRKLWRVIPVRESCEPGRLIDRLR
jgi:hypothetical protein